MDTTGYRRGRKRNSFSVHFQFLFFCWASRAFSAGYRTVTVTVTISLSISPTAKYLSIVSKPHLISFHDSSSAPTQPSTPSSMKHISGSESPGESLPTTETPPNGSTIKPVTSRWQSALNYIQTEISLKHADIPIIACCLVSGLCDSSSYNAWSCFVSMQTGNTIFLALGASGQPRSKPYGWLKSLTSITFFLIGCFMFANTRFVRPKARGTLTTSFVLQSICIIVAAALVEAGVVPEPVGLVAETGDVNLKELIPLAFLAFQSGGQIVTSRLLGFNEVPTTVLTSVYCDLASDPNFLVKDNVKRNRRLGAVFFLLVGGIAGGWISRSSAGLSTTLWIAAAIKMSIAIGWSVWKPKPSIQL